MRYINPKTDFGFKKIFGSTESKAILISFLNAIIYNEEEIIKNLEIIDPYKQPEIKGRKYTFLDFKARLKDGTKVIIEMQMLNAESFEKRILYNAAKAYALQLTKGQEYYVLNPVIAITITDFIMFKEYEDYRSCFFLQEKTHLREFLSKDFQLIFIELTKFKKPLIPLEITTKIELLSEAKINQLTTELLTIENLNHLESWLEINI